MHVIDASVVVKWFIEEEDSTKALALKQRHLNGQSLLIAPDLLVCETANVLLSSNLFTVREAKRCLQNLYELEIDFMAPSPGLIALSIELAFVNQITIYDALYLATAKQFNIQLVTADRKLHRATQGLSCTILLSELTL